MQAMQENINAWWELRLQRQADSSDPYLPMKNATLEYVNAVRAEFMLPPLSKLPKGRVGARDGCVVYNALVDTGVVRAVGTSYTHMAGSPRLLRAHPREVKEFIVAFDNRRIPELMYS